MLSLDDVGGELDLICRRPHFRRHFVCVSAFYRLNERNTAGGGVEKRATRFLTRIQSGVSPYDLVDWSFSHISQYENVVSIVPFVRAST